MLIIPIYGPREVYGGHHSNINVGEASIVWNVEVLAFMWCAGNVKTLAALTFFVKSQRKFSSIKNTHIMNKYFNSIVT